VRPQVSKCGCDQSFALVPPISVLKAFVYAASDFVGCRDIAAFRITFELAKNFFTLSNKKQTPRWVQMVGKALLFLSGVSRLASAPAWLVLLANTAQFADQLDKFIRPALLCLHLGTALPPRAAIASAPPLLWHCGRGSGCRSCVFYCRSLEELQSRSCHSPSDQPYRPSRSHRTKGILLSVHL